MAIQEFGQSRQEAFHIEKLPDKKLGGLLLAFGNHEAKALLLASMKLGVSYSSSDVDNLFAQNQGHYSVWEMRVVPFYSYCRRSFAPSGLVRPASRNADLEATSYKLTNYAAEVGVPLAGHLLDFSERDPDVSLIHIFGNNPFARVRIFREILAGELPLREADLVKKLGETPHLIGEHLGNLRRHGIINYDSTVIDKPYARFKVSPQQPNEPPPVWARNVTLTNEVYRAIQDNPGIEISAENLYPVLAYRNPELMFNEEDKMHRITAVLTHFETNGYLQRIKFGLYRQSEITLTDNQRRTMSQLMSILERFLTQDPSFLEEGRLKARQIVNNPRRFSVLLQKARENSPKVNDASANETMKQILSILYSHPNATNSEIQKYLLTGFQRDLSRQRIATLTQILQSGGVIIIAAKGTGFHFEIPVVKTTKGSYTLSSKEGRRPIKRTKRKRVGYY